MSFDTIRVDYDELEATALKFRHQADEVRELYRLLMRNILQLRDDGWLGRGADAFYAEMEDDVLPAVQRLIAALEEADLTSRQVVRLFRAAEEEAAAPFQE